MGGIMSKKRFSVRRKKKSKKGRNEVVLEPVYEEPQYMEIGLGRDNLSVVSHMTLPSSDSAFSERSSTLDRTSSLRSAVVYDVPGQSACSVSSRKNPCNIYNIDAYKCDDGGHDDDGDESDDDYSDVHTYISMKDIKERTATSTRTWCQIPLEEVPYMVEAFQPLLERTIDVLEVIPHLPFIEVHEFARVDDPHRAVEMLIAKVKASDEPGKWQAFLHALNVTEYQYIVSLLRGETEEDHSVNRELLRLFTPQIMNRVDPDEFIDHLFEQEVINERDMEEVRREKERHGATSASLLLLHKVPRRISNWFSVFLEVLKKCGMEDLVGHFQIPEISTITRTSVKHTRISRKKKRLSATRILRNTDLDYLTPIYGRGRKPIPPLPPARHSVTSPLTLPHDNSLKQNLDLSTDYISTTGVVIPPKRRDSVTEIESLQKRRDSLKRRLEKKKLIRQLHMELRTLKKEIDEFRTDPDEEDENVSKDTAAENTSLNDSTNGEYIKEETGGKFMENNIDKLNGNHVDELNGNHVKGTGMPENDTDNNFNAKDQEIPLLMKEGYINAAQVDNEQRQKMLVEQICQHLTNVKEELKQEMLEMRDQVTNAVLKHVMSSSTLPELPEENSYVTVEPAQNIQPVMLYNITNKQNNGLLHPTLHNIPRHYSVDSAIFSDYVPLFSSSVNA